MPGQHQQRQAGNGGVARQALLLPEVVELDEPEADRLAYRQRLPDAPNDPALVYRLASQVPAHWIPLVPKGNGDALHFIVTLQRGGMARFYSVEPALMADKAYADFIALLKAQNDFIEEGAVENGVQTFVLHPRGRLLKVDPGAMGDALAPPAVELDSNAAVKVLVSAGSYPAVISELAVANELRDGRLVEIPLDDVDLSRSLNAVWRRGTRLDGAAGQFLRTARPSTRGSTRAHTP